MVPASAVISITVDVARSALARCAALDAVAWTAGEAMPMAADSGATSASQRSLLSRSDPRSFWKRVPDSLGLKYDSMW